MALKLSGLRKNKSGEISIYLNLSKLKEEVIRQQKALICSYCKKSLDITKQPFSKPWISNGIYHAECLNKLREEK